MNKYKSAEEAIKIIQSGQRVFVQGSAATPTVLLKALFARKDELKGVELVSITTMGDVHFDPKELGGSFFINSLFVSENVRNMVNTEYGEYVPVFLS